MGISMRSTSVPVAGRELHSYQARDRLPSGALRLEPRTAGTYSAACADKCPRFSRFESSIGRSIVSEDFRYAQARLPSLCVRVSRQPGVDPETMDTEVSSALSTLELDPRNKDARAAISSAHRDRRRRSRQAGVRPVRRARLPRRTRQRRAAAWSCATANWRSLTDKRARADLLAEKARLLFHEFARAEQAVEMPARGAGAGAGPPGRRRAAAQGPGRGGGVGEDRPDPAEAGQGPAGPSPPPRPHFAVAGELYLKYRPRGNEGETHLRPGGGDRSPPEAGRAAAGAAVPGRRPHRRPGQAVRAPGRPRPSTTTIAPPPRCWRARWRWSRARRPRRSSTSSGRWPPARASRGRCTGWWPTLAGTTRTGPSWPRSTRTPCACQKRGQGELALLVPLATVTWRKLDNLDQAELYFRRIRKAEPNHPALMEFYRDYHTRRGEIPQLLALFAQAQKAETDPEKRIRLGIEMAELAEQRPQSAEKAIDVWKSLLRMRPGPARGGDRAAPPVHQDREVERAARDAEGRSRGAAQGRRRREDRAATWR